MLFPGKFMTDIATIVSTAIAGALAIIAGIFKEKLMTWAKKKVENLFSVKVMTREVAMRTFNVNNQLVELRVLADADRAYIFKFHNGEYFSIKDPVWKVSCSNESVRDGISYEIQNLRNIMVSSIIDFILPLFSPETKINGFTLVDHERAGCNSLCKVQKDIIYCDVNKMDATASKAILQGQGIDYVLMLPLTHKDQILGFVGLDYCHDNTIDFKKAMPALCEKSTRIAYAIYG